MANLFWLSGTVDAKPYMSPKGYVSMFYMKTYAPSRSKTKKRMMFVKCVAFNKTARRCHDMIRPGMRISVEGQITTSAYVDKRCKHKHIMIQLVVRDFHFMSTQWEASRLQIAMDIASAEDYEKHDEAEDGNEAEETGDGEIGV